MLRLRICALLLVILTLVVAIWAWTMDDMMKIVIALLFASACLAVVSPFDAIEPRQRLRVLLVCMIYVAALAAAIFWAYTTAAPGLLTSALVLLAQAGIGLVLWAFATRKRRRIPSARRYYDN